MSDSVAAPKPTPDRGDIYTATQMLATAPDTPVSVQALDAPELTDNTTTAIAWDTPQARQAWARHLLDRRHRCRGGEGLHSRIAGPACARTGHVGDTGECGGQPSVDRAPRGGTHDPPLE